MSQINPIAIITDSTCDIPQNLREQYDIKIVPLYVLWGDEQLRDTVDITSQEFYERLAIDPLHPSTSQPTPLDFQHAIEAAAADGAQEAVVLTISEQLSGTLESARQAAAMTDLPVHPHDSRSTSMGLGFQVLAAARVRDAGGSAVDMIAAAEDVRHNLAVLFTVDTLEYLHRGGRIGGATKLLGHALQLKPQLLIDPELGTVEAGTRVRTRRKALDAVYNGFGQQVGGNGSLHATVIHVGAEEEAAKMAERLENHYDIAELICKNVSPVLGVHGGPGLVGIIGYREDSPT